MATTAPKAVPKAVPKVVPVAGAESDAPAPARKSKKKLIVSGLAVVLLAGIGGGAWFYLNQDEAGAKHVAAKPKAMPPVFVNLESFTVNLQSEGSEQFLQVAFTVQVPEQTEVEAIKLYMPQVRSRVLLLLSGKKASEISTVEGKKKLADEIMAQIKQPFAPSGASLAITNVFFTSFVIQ
jgi:flagellar FliL protein